MYQKVFDIRKRCLNFAVAVNNFSLQLKNHHQYEIANQITRSSMSVGANLAEAYSSQSKKEFLRIANIALREINETSYLFELITKLRTFHSSELSKLKQESTEISKILTTIIMNTKENMGK